MTETVNYRDPSIPRNTLENKIVDLQNELYKYQNPSRWKKFWFSRAGTYEQEIRFVWFIVILLCALTAFGLPLYLLVTSNVAREDVVERRECRQVCALMGGTQSAYYDDRDSCYCRTPHIAPGYIEIK